MAQDVSSADRARPYVGTCARVAGVGQKYRIVDLVDDATALIEVKSWDEPLPYPLREVEFDLAGNMSAERFVPLIGQYRSMGPDGPEYMVASIESSTAAKIWIVGNEENDEYAIEDILIDPIVYDGK